MDAINKMETRMGLLLNIGTLIASLLVGAGGIFYLLDVFNQPASTEILIGANTPIRLSQLWDLLKTDSPLGFIELGVLCLIGMQFLRVGLLAWFYMWTRDYWFLGFSLFILMLLFYSLFR